MDFRRFRPLPLVFSLTLAFGSGPIRAEEQKPAPPEPPKPLVTVPVGLIAGRTNVVNLRGLRLKDATSVTLEGLAGPTPVEIRKREDAKVPGGLTAARAGDQQLELAVLVPAAAVGATNVVWKVTGTNGVGVTVPVPVLDAEHWVESTEPNGGFKEAQLLKPGQGVRGTLEKGGDVDVFRVEAAVGQKLHAEVRAARLGSTLDGILTLYDERGTILTTNDDAFGSDPALTFTLAIAGPVFVVVTYANEQPGVTHGYLLSVEVGK